MTARKKREVVDRKPEFRELKKRLAMTAAEIAIMTGKSVASVEGYAGTVERLNPPQLVIDIMKNALRYKAALDLAYANAKPVNNGDFVPSEDAQKWVSQRRSEGQPAVAFEGGAVAIPRPGDFINVSIGKPWDDETAADPDDIEAIIRPMAEDDQKPPATPHRSFSRFRRVQS